VLLLNAGSAALLVTRDTAREVVFLKGPTGLEQSTTRVSAKAKIADEIHYGLNHWDWLTRFLDDGRLELTKLVNLWPASGIDELIWAAERSTQARRVTPASARTSSRRSRAVKRPLRLTDLSSLPW
jgi:alpha-galactosidase/6-phospho-beta-glucosidase family protein